MLQVYASTIHTLTNSLICLREHGRHLLLSLLHQCLSFLLHLLEGYQANGAGLELLLHSVVAGRELAVDAGELVLQLVVLQGIP